MEQTITLKIKLYEPTRAKQEVYQEMTDRTTEFANKYLGLDKKDRPKTSKEAKEHSKPLPSAILAQAIRDIKSKPKAKRFKRLWPAFNNQNFRVEREYTVDGGAVYKVSFPTLERRVGVPIVVTPYQKKYLDLLLAGKVKQGVARLVKCGRDWYIHLSLTVPVERTQKPEKIMGVDLGLIDLLVASAGGQTLFFSGGQLAYVRRKYAKLRRELQKAGAYRALKRLGDKEHLWATDVNHKLSRVLVNFAIAHGVTKIRLEDLTGARWTKAQGKEQREDPGRSLHYWPYYQLRQFIEYKAALAGIQVELVNPDLTTLTCSRCGETVKSRPGGRWFRCPRCKRIKHIDVNAADNIAQAVSGLAS
ncbi:IS200/IS605 family element transposase accessory protein TnpB [Desulfofundulus sp. TPOSR]|uniref:RNA-guided endonuclease TnpB family protein n=1 Tax=Desulfofundulus sp. TPOSR TaxID=2714340 RepID=UPI00140AF4C4|nr:RNA-guided endonuclease TnpB family protein [Desulfofundulus sp. TPOSR]NHM26932.1 IS200/IS605 family element transposase accessory protein TnpB [Desulfofundulus sp. TPOSR]